MKKAITLMLVTVFLLSFCACSSGNVPGDTATTDSGTTAKPDIKTTTVSDADTTSPNDPLKPIKLIIEGKSDYVIVRPDEDSSDIPDGMYALSKAFSEKYGITLSLNVDWLNTRIGETPPAHEILLGDTNREESQSFTVEGEYEFVIAVVNEKVVIKGGSVSATLYAVDYFIANLLNNETELDANLRIESKIPETVPRISGEITSEREETELYHGVTSTYYSLAADSVYGLQKLTVVEFDPKQPDLYFRVTMGGTYANKLTTTSKTVGVFNSNNTEQLKAISAVNGDLWMVTYAHARVEGSGTEYGGCTDAVVTKSLTVPRGFNMYNGEIITSSHMTQETPYEGAFYSFGITEDGVAVLGNPKLTISVENTTKSTTASADGLNRLPANNALVVYSDVYSNSNYSLSDAYEVIIDCSVDYKICHGASVTGKVTAITKPGETKYNMKENRIILTARGAGKIALISGYSIGDTVKLGFTVTDSMGNNAVWQKMTNCVGGHIPVIVNGVKRASTDESKYPMSVLGIKSNGNVVMLTNDGRQSGWSVGIKINQLGSLCEELDIETAFILDGGGSATMVNLVNGDYPVVNRPSDAGNAERTVVNAVILAYGPEKNN